MTLLRKRMEELGDSLDHVRDDVEKFAVPKEAQRARALVLTKIDEAKLWLDRLVEEWPRCPQCAGLGFPNGSTQPNCDACGGDGYARP